MSKYAVYQLQSGVTPPNSGKLHHKYGEMLKLSVYHLHSGVTPSA